MLAAVNRTNAEAVEDARRLGHIDPARDRVIDLTYGKGMWWKIIRPEHFWRIDLDPHPDALDPDLIDRMDATALPDAWAQYFDVAAVDPPYKLNGTDQGEGRRYGVHEFASATARHELAYRLLAEAARVTKPGGRILYKCQAQVNGGKLRWQNYQAYGWATELGLTLVEELAVLGGRAQPERTRADGTATRQEHARYRPSLMMIFRTAER